MPELPLLQDELLQDESALEARIAALEQENSALQAALADCKNQQLPPFPTSPSLSPALTDRLLQATAIAANTLLSIAHFDEAVSTALRIIGEALGSDRINVIENFNPPSEGSFLHWRVLYEWNSPGTVPQFSDLEAAQGNYREIPELFEQLQQGHSLSYLLEEAPEPFRSSQAAIGVKSTQIVPVYVEGKWWGVLGLDDCRQAKRRSPAELSVLQIAADCLGSAIQRERTQQALLFAEQVQTAALAQANEELQQRDRLLSVVAEVTKDLLENSEVEAAIAQALQGIGEAARISRVTLMQEKVEADSGRLQHHVIQEWAAPSVPRQIEDPSTCVMYNDDYSVLIDELHAGQSVWHTLEYFPEPARTQQGDIGVKSTGAVPIFIEGEYVGCVGFDDCINYRQWTAHEIDVLASGAGAIGASLHRKQLIDRLVSERIQAEQERAAELAKANIALRETLASLAATQDIQGFLQATLREIARQAGACATHLFRYESSTHQLRQIGCVCDGTLYPNGHPDDPISFCKGFSADVTPAFQLLTKQRNLIWQAADEPDEYTWPDTIAWHHKRGHVAHAGQALVAGDQPVGFLGIAFCDRTTLTPGQTELIQALANQMALALELTRLAEAAKQAAIAREQEKAAQDRATELEQVNTQLQQSERRLQDLINTMSDWAWEVDANGIYSFVDEKVSKILGYQPEEMLGKSPFAFMPPDEAKRVSEAFSSIAAEQVTFSRLENRNLTKDGRQVVFETSGTPMFDPEGKLSGYRGADCDVTELRQMQDALLRAEQERVAELAKANNALRRSVGHLTTANNLQSFLIAVLQESIQASGAVGAGVFVYDPPSHTLQMTALLLQGEAIDIATDPRAELWRMPVPADTTAAWHVMSQERKIIWIDNDNPPPEHWPMSQRWHNQCGHKVIAAIPLLIGEQALGFLGLCFTAHQPENSSKLEQCWALTQHATLALQMSKLAEEAKQAGVLEERNRMASEIHDSMAQSFMGVLMQLQAANRFFASKPDQAQACITRAQTLAKEGLAEARLSVWSLCQESADYCFIAETLTRITEQLTTGTPIQATVKVEGTPHGLQSEVGMNLLRIAQEALTNALRHAQAQTIQVQLKFAAEVIQLRIQDDGKGFDPQQRSSGFGLVSMRQRAEQIGAQLTIDTQAGAGTAIAATLPLR
ncbi:MAG: GAF domain-containing protein [Cyanobacteria bacterium Co-bin13]|nr:GAF domain-containing protein [Cyanobacteria bacterium Co-bin13]